MAYAWHENIDVAYSRLSERTCRLPACIRLWWTDVFAWSVWREYWWRRPGGAYPTQRPSRLALELFRLCRMSSAARRLCLLLLDQWRGCLLRQTPCRDIETAMWLLWRSIMTHSLTRLAYIQWRFYVGAGGQLHPQFLALHPSVWHDAIIIATRLILVYFVVSIEIIENPKFHCTRTDSAWWNFHVWKFHKLMGYLIGMVWGLLLYLEVN